MSTKAGVLTIFLGLSLASGIASATPDGNVKPVICESLFDRIHISKPKFALFNLQIFREKSEFTSEEKDRVIDFMTSTQLSADEFVALFNKVDSLIPVREVDTVLMIIDLSLAHRLPVEKVASDLGYFRQMVSNEIGNRQKKEMGFTAGQIIEPLTWDEAAPFFLHFLAQTKKSANLELGEYIDWSFELGVEDKLDLVANMNVMNQFNLKWDGVKAAAPQLKQLDFVAPSIGFNQELQHTHPSLHQIFLILGLLKQQGVSEKEALAYTMKYVNDRDIHSTMGLLEALENDAPPKPTTTLGTATYSSPTN